MNRATLYRMSDTVILGELMTTDRFWGGPGSIALFFVLECNRPRFTSADGWNERSNALRGSHRGRSQAGMVLSFDLEGVRRGALRNRHVVHESGKRRGQPEKAELDGWDFRRPYAARRGPSGTMLGPRLARQKAAASTSDQIYTDLWHDAAGASQNNDGTAGIPTTGGKYVDTPLAR